jgi:uncharacterized lipoprotein YmbA
MQRMSPRMLFAPLLAILVLTGCGTTQPSRFYLLTPVQSDTAPAGLGTVRLGIGPIVLPEYLQRSQIVIRQTGGNELHIDETNRWAEPLAANFARVLAENLSSRLGTERLVSYPWNRGTALDYQVPIEIQRFEADEDLQVRLDVRWDILNANGEVRVGPRRQRITIRSQAADYASLVTAQSEAVARLGASIADEIRELERPRR